MRKQKALKDYYINVSDKTGNKVDYTRTQASLSLKRFSKSSIILSDSSKEQYPITNESHKHIPKFTEFWSDRINEYVHKSCVKVLKEFKDYEIGTEGAVTLRLSDFKMFTAKGNKEEGTVEIKAFNEPFIAVHNHASGDTFSILDLDLFGSKKHCIGIVAVSNDGHTTYSLIKEKSYDEYEFSRLRAMIYIGRINIGDEEFMKEVVKCGVKYKKRNS